MTNFRAEAPAKINLALAITGRREDGYHLLRSVFLRLALHDVLEVEMTPTAERDVLAIEGGMDAADDNLVLRAAAALRESIDPALPALHFRLQKRIPVSAGLGGGSSDAAAAHDLALQAWGVRLHPTERLEAALRLGADVPFFAAGHAASLVDGVGEGLRPLPAPEPPAGLVLITPGERLATADVFDEFDREPPTDSDVVGRVDEVAALLRENVDGMTLAATTAMLRDANDLWAPATRLSAGLAAARDSAASILGRAVMLTGSGPTLYAVYPSEAAATRAAIDLQTQRPEALEGAAIMTTTSIGSGGDS
jgi:4-diphosphocytidyl-2-C-methyl-D-erythritol kinase